MLSQFGRSIFDALLALQFSVEGSHEDGYALQLEPELGRLAVDIRSGFHHVASCIHKWRFDVLPPGINLEQDIADLETRMDAVRHTGIGFSQAEILRAYAVQLHLKQIARLLRASRVETSRTVGSGKRLNAQNLRRRLRQCRWPFQQLHLRPAHRARRSLAGCEFHLPQSVDAA